MSPSLGPTLSTPTRSSPTTGSATAFGRPGTLPAPSEPVAPITTAVPSVVAPLTALRPATPEDSRRISTLLDADRIEQALAALGLLETKSPVVRGLRSGLNVGISTTLDRTYLFQKYSSSNLEPVFIDSYIAGEEAAGRYSQAFSPDELEALIGHFVTSVLELVPKPNSSKLRMIQNLSFPRSDPSCPSVNSFVNPDDFSTALGTYEETSRLILSLPDGCRAATFDIPAAYRITPVRSSQQNFVCVFWLVYVDRAACFGLSSSAGVFGSIADMLVAIYMAISSLVSSAEDEYCSIAAKKALPCLHLTFNFPTLTLSFLTAVFS